MTFPKDKLRKDMPMATGLMDYFSAALAEVAAHSKASNDKHNPKGPHFWARGKSSDHADCIARHLVERGGFDEEGRRHSAALAWRALALLQEELEAEGCSPSRASVFTVDDAAALEARDHYIGLMKDSVG